MPRRCMHHDWLPADDEANVSGYWVPTPEEIKEQCALIRKLRVGNEGTCFFELLRRLQDKEAA